LIGSPILSTSLKEIKRKKKRIKTVNVKTSTDKQSSRGKFPEDHYWFSSMASV